MSYIGDVGRLDSTINSDFSKYTYEYIATEGQTVFTGTDINSATLGYTAGNVLVTYGGADLAFSDYTATDGTSVVLADGAVAGKIIRVVAFQAFEVADAYTKAQADDLLAIKATLASPSFTGTVDVAGPVSADGLTVDTTVNNGAVITAHDNVTTTYPLKVQNNAGTGRLELGTYGINNNIDLKFQTQGNERVRITTDGFVGINLTDPDEVLEVSGDLKISGSGFGIVQFGDTSDVTKIIGRDGAHASSPNTMEFWTNSTERMTIDSDGDLLVGATSGGGGNKIYSRTNVNADPATSGTAQTGGALRLSGADNAVLDFGLNSINTWIQATDSSNLVVNYKLSLNPNGGNVGIGTLTPATTLDVTGTVTADGLVVSGNSYVGSGNTFTDATSGYFFAGNGQYTNGIYGVGVNNVAIAAGGSERMRIDSSGDITTTGNLTIDGFGSGKDISFRSGYGSDNVGIRAKAITTANRDGLEILGYNGIDLTVNNGAKVAVHVDAVGRVTTPYQPSFRAYSPPITVAGNTIIWASTAHNITSSFSTSTGLFTAPVAGTYYFSHSILVRYVSPHYARVVWILNGSTAMINGDNLTDMPGPSYVSVGLSISVYMSANDTIGVVNTGAETYGPGYGHFSGHLLG